MKILSIVGNRPQFIKAAVVQHAWRTLAKDSLDMRLVHTGQHYDANLSDIFFKELDITPPHHQLALKGTTATEQISHMIHTLGQVFAAESPDAILVYGDTNSTIAGALTAAHMHIPLFHAEAGERIYLRDQQPEEINRVVTDHLSTACLTASKKAQGCLEKEGISPTRIHFVGDPMYDLFLQFQPRIEAGIDAVLANYGLTKENYILATIHRAENTDNTDRLQCILNNLDAMRMPVILPLHPRTKKHLDILNWQPKAALKLIPPCGYIEIMQLLKYATLTVTDSGGLSRESFWAKKPSIVPMSAAPWPEIEAAGWMHVLTPKGDNIAALASEIKAPTLWPQGLFGDGKASEKIIAYIQNFAKTRHPTQWRPA